MAVLRGRCFPSPSYREGRQGPGKLPDLSSTTQLVEIETQKFKIEGGARQMGGVQCVFYEIGDR